MMPTVDELMTPSPWCVTPGDSLDAARGLMDLHSIRHLPVVDGDRLVGVLRRRDIAVMDDYPALKAFTVGSAMLPAVSVSPNLTLSGAVDLMVENELDCLIVRSNDGRIAGIFTAVDAHQGCAALAST